MLFQVECSWPCQATRPTHCSVRGNQTQWANHTARKGGVVEAEDINRGEGEWAKLTWSWQSLCQLNSSACSVPSEASELGHWPGYPASNDLHCRQRVWALFLSVSLVHSHTHTRSLTCYQQTPTPSNKAICSPITVRHQGYFSLPVPSAKRL